MTPEITVTCSDDDDDDDDENDDPEEEDEEEEGEEEEERLRRRRRKDRKGRKGSPSQSTTAASQSWNAAGLSNRAVRYIYYLLREPYITLKFIPFSYNLIVQLSDSLII